MKGESLIKWVFIGILVYILCYIFVAPLLNFLSPLFFKFTLKFCSFFADSMYKSAARMDNNQFDSAFFAFFTGFYIWVPIMGLFIAFRKNKKSVSGEDKTYSKKRVKLIILSIFLIISVPFMTIAQYTAYILNLRFMQKLNIVAPYLSEQEEEEVVSKWAQMENRDDYRYICEDLHRSALANNVAKPDKLWSNRTPF